MPESLPQRPTHRLLIDQPPRMFQPGLAMAVGLSEAIFLQQLHYWLTRSQNERMGRWWVYNTLEEWQIEFPWWSVPTIRRIIARLEESGLIISSQEFNAYPTDRTKWYTINYDELAQKGRHAPSVGIDGSKLAE